MEKIPKIVFLNVRLIRNVLVYVGKPKSRKQFLVIFMWKWVYILFLAEGKYDKTVYMKNRWFFTKKSIYIWNLLLKSFPVIGRRMGKGDCKLHICCFLEKKSLKRQYLTGTETEKTSKKVFFNVHLKRNLLVYVAKRKSEKEFLVIFMQKWV